MELGGELQGWISMRDRIFLCEDFMLLLVKGIIKDFYVLRNIVRILRKEL